MAKPIASWVITPDVPPYKTAVDARSKQKTGVWSGYMSHEQWAELRALLPPDQGAEDYVIDEDTVVQRTRTEDHSSRMDEETMRQIWEILRSFMVTHG